MSGTRPIPLLTPMHSQRVQGVYRHRYFLINYTFPSNTTQVYFKLIYAFTCMLHVVFAGINVVYPVINTTDVFHKASFSFCTFLRAELLRGQTRTFDLNI